MRAKPTAHKKPSWKPRVSESVVESAATLKPEERYYRNLFLSSGHEPDNEVFQMLFDEGILQYDENENPASTGLVYKRSVTFTPEGAEYALEQVTARLKELQAVRKGLLLEIARFSIEQTAQD